MNTILPKLSPAAFAVALVCFLLPWVNITCQGKTVASFSGTQFVTGTSVEEPGMFRSKSRHVDPEPLAIVAAGLTLAGLAVSFIKKKSFSLLCAVLGGAGVVVMLFLKAKIDSDLQREAQGAFEATYAAGYWIAVLAFLAAAVLSGYAVWAEKKVPITTSTVSPEGVQKTASHS